MTTIFTPISTLPLSGPHHYTIGANPVAATTCTPTQPLTSLTLLGLCTAGHNHHLLATLTVTVILG